MKIAYLGDANSHSYFVTKENFPNDNLISYSTIREVMNSVEDRQVDMCIVPIENSVEGTVNECLDSLRRLSLYISQEFYVPIHQNLIGLKCTKISEVKKIFSHPQALSQCREYLCKNFPKAQLVPLTSTSEGLKKVDATSLAVARQPQDNQIILKSNIEDYPNNTTRFIALVPNVTLKGNKISIMFDAPHKSGGLLSVLNILAQYNLNMHKIESRPNKDMVFRYYFYVECDCDFTKDKLMMLLSDIGKKCNFIKFLGRY